MLFDIWLFNSYIWILLDSPENHKALFIQLLF